MNLFNRLKFWFERVKTGKIMYVRVNLVRGQNSAIIYTRESEWHIWYFCKFSHIIIFCATNHEYAVSFTKYNTRAVRFCLTPTQDHNEFFKIFSILNLTKIILCVNDGMYQRTSFHISTKSTSNLINIVLSFVQQFSKLLYLKIIHITHFPL